MDTRVPSATGAKPQIIAGKYFRSDENSELNGQILNEVSICYFLVRLRTPDCQVIGQKIFHVARMVNWSFFNTEDEWLDACEGSATAVRHCAAISAPRGAS